jgi:hypothetical protein
MQEHESVKSKALQTFVKNLGAPGDFMTNLTGSNLGAPRQKGENQRRFSSTSFG